MKPAPGGGPFILEKGFSGVALFKIKQTLNGTRFALALFDYTQGKMIFKRYCN